MFFGDTVDQSMHQCCANRGFAAKVDRVIQVDPLEIGDETRTDLVRA
jgi:hypothetical protein